MTQRIEIPENELDFFVELTSDVITQCPCGHEMYLTPDGNPDECEDCGRHFWAVITVKAWREVNAPHEV